MRRRGLIRLWVVMTAVFVPGLAFWAVNDSMNTWARIDRITIEQCVNEETADPRTDATACVHKRGADQTMFQHEHTTPGHYWRVALGFAFLFDLFITALILGAFFVGQWVVRGFKAEIQ
jgi:hypothetical protein